LLSVLAPSRHGAGVGKWNRFPDDPRRRGQLRDGRRGDPPGGALHRARGRGLDHGARRRPAAGGAAAPARPGLEAEPAAVELLFASLLAYGSIAEISFLLGVGHRNAFHRAFQRWTA